MTLPKALPNVFKAAWVSRNRLLQRLKEEKTGEHRRISETSHYNNIMGYI